MSRGREVILCGHGESVEFCSKCKIAKLEQQLKTEFDTGYKMGVKEAMGEIEKLRRQLKEAESVIEFVDENIDDIEGYTQGCESIKKDIGKRARQYLTKYKTNE
jgi:hypothetical protein